MQENHMESYHDTKKTFPTCSRNIFKISNDKFLLMTRVLMKQVLKLELFDLKTNKQITKLNVFLDANHEFQFTKKNFQKSSKYHKIFKMS